MKTVRIYKDDIRTNILRSLFFTDTILTAFSGLCIAIIIFILFKYLLHIFSWGSYLSTVIVTEVIFLILITQKIDNQSIYKIIPRGITYKLQGKEFRQAQLEPYFTEFIIQDNFIVRKNSIIRVYEVEPFDIALLNDQDKEHFFQKLKQTIHVLPSQVQFIVRKEKATVSDYTRHFFSLYKQSDQKREKLIFDYTHDLTRLIETDKFFTVKHYAVFSVEARSEKIKSKTNAIKKLNDMGIRFGSALQAAHIDVRILTNEELISFTQSLVR
jgi:hypothetical protein